MFIGDEIGDVNGDGERDVILRAIDDGIVF